MISLLLEKKYFSKLNYLGFRVFKMEFELRLTSDLRTLEHQCVPSFASEFKLVGYRGFFFFITNIHSYRCGITIRRVVCGFEAETIDIDGIVKIDLNPRLVRYRLEPFVPFLLSRKKKVLRELFFGATTARNRMLSFDLSFNFNFDEIQLLIRLFTCVEENFTEL